LIYPEKLHQALGIQAFVKDAPVLHAAARSPESDGGVIAGSPAAMHMHAGVGHLD
jgi:hypothetical protein